MYLYKKARLHSTFQNRSQLTKTKFCFTFRSSLEKSILPLNNSVAPLITKWSFVQVKRNFYNNYKLREKSLISIINDWTLKKRRNYLHYCIQEWLSCWFKLNGLVIRCINKNSLILGLRHIFKVYLNNGIQR